MIIIRMENFTKVLKDWFIQWVSDYISIGILLFFVCGIMKFLPNDFKFFIAILTIILFILYKIRSRKKEKERQKLIRKQVIHAKNK